MLELKGLEVGELLGHRYVWVSSEISIQLQGRHCAFLGVKALGFPRLDEQLLLEVGQLLRWHLVRLNLHLRLVLLVIFIDLLLVTFEALNLGDLVEYSVTVVALLGEENVLP